MSSPVATFDATDVPFVPVADLAAALSILSPGGRNVRMPRGLNEQDLTQIESRLWSSNERAATRTAAMIRIRCLVETLTLPRFNSLFALHGAGMMQALLAAAGSVRLNAARGFNPTRLMWAIEQGVTGPAPTVREDEALPMAA